MEGTEADPSSREEHGARHGKQQQRLRLQGKVEAKQDTWTKMHLRAPLGARPAPLLALKAEQKLTPFLTGGC